jgi:hypothetical protein
MVRHVSELNPIYQQRLGVLKGLFAGHFTTPDAVMRAQATISNTVAQQVNYWAFVELFYVIAWVSAFCALGTLLFRGVKTAGPVVVH